MECEKVKCEYNAKILIGGIHSFPLKVFKADIGKIEKTLHPLHYLTLQASSIYVRLCASKAADIKMVPAFLMKQLPIAFEDPNELRSKAASAAMKQVLKFECIASECDGRDHPSGEIIHSVVYKASTVMFHACQDLVVCPSSMWPNDALKMIKRYIPAMKLQFGDIEVDVANLKRKILGETSISGIVENLHLLSRYVGDWVYV